jgi:hypothetical protein
MATAFRKLDVEQLKKDIEARFERVRMEENKVVVSTGDKASIPMRAAVKQLK